MTRVLLFDIDQTLLYTGGAGGLAMNLAFEEMFGISDGFGKIEFSGRTDLGILADALAHHGITGGHEAHLQEFLRRYYAHLPQTLHKKRGYLMPGFPQLLEALSVRDGVRLGLATGNFSETARVKLEHYGINRFFAGGGFGEESVDRTDVIRVAIERIANGAAPADILIIGDTPRDVVAALDNGVVGVGVATGNYSVDQLRKSGAELVFDDFSDWERAADILAGASTGS